MSLVEPSSLSFVPIITQNLSIVPNYVFFLVIVHDIKDIDALIMRRVATTMLVMPNFMNVIFPFLLLILQINLPYSPPRGCLSTIPLLHCCVKSPCLTIWPLQFHICLFIKRRPLFRIPLLLHLYHLLHIPTAPLHKISPLLHQATCRPTKPSPLPTWLVYLL